MNMLPCEIIRDLMPSYCDGLCSDATKSAVEAHVSSCESCGKVLDVMQSTVRFRPAADDAEKKNIESIARFLKRTKFKALLIGLLAATVPFAVGIFLYNATHWENTAVSPDMVTFEAYRLKNGDIACVFHYPGGDDGTNIITSSSGMLGDETAYTEIMEPLIVLNAAETVYTDVYNLDDEFYAKINTIYYGKPDGNEKLIWREGMTLPAAPDEIENEAAHLRRGRSVE
jgi:hypothetical protein